MPFFVVCPSRTVGQGQKEGAKGSGGPRRHQAVGERHERPSAALGHPHHARRAIHVRPARARSAGWRVRNRFYRSYRLLPTLGCSPKARCTNRVGFHESQASLPFRSSPRRTARPACRSSCRMHRPAGTLAAIGRRGLRTGLSLAVKLGLQFSHESPKGFDMESELRAIHARKVSKRTYSRKG